MLFGNRERLAFEIRPLTPTWERRHAPEQTTWAALSVWTRGQNLCRHSESGADVVHDALNVPLAPIADWLVRSSPYIAFEERAALFAVSEHLHDTWARWGASLPPAGVHEDDWYDRREEWWSRHFLSAGADGAILPDVALVRQDERLILEWRQPRCDGLTFLSPEGSLSVDWTEAQGVLAEFVRSIADWLRRDGLPTLYPWLESHEPFLGHTVSLPMALELYTGRRAEELVALTGAKNAAQLFERLGLPANADDPAASPVTQALRDLPPQLPPEAGRVLLELDQATRGTAAAHGLARLRTVALDARRDAATPEEAGYAAARAIRDDLRMDGQPLPDDDLRGFLGFLGLDLTLSAQRAPGTRMLMGWRPDGRASAIVLASQRTQVKWGQRFEAARALGHALLDPQRQGVIGAASSAFAQDIRRRRSGAFAAELLLPDLALRQASGGALDRAAEPDVFATLLSRFGVGARTAAHQLWNHQLLSSPEVRDQLIDDYGAQAAG